jgi:hypothetical protein
MSDETTIQRHEPERAASRADAVAPAGCCCCCCCCCLHTVGGIIGGVMGSVKDVPPTRAVRFNDDDDEPPIPFRRDAFEDENSPLPVPLLYWLLVLFLGAVTAAVTYLNDPRGEPGTLVLGAILAIMVLPALQLGASLLTTIIVLIFYPDKSFPLRRIGWITLYSFLGTMIGVTMMAGCCGVFLLPGAAR